MERRTHVDLFAGAGGMGLGLEMAGFDPVFVSELHPHALETYLRNRPGALVHKPDHQVLDLLEYTSQPRLLKDLATRLGSVDLLTGGPPCQGYSGIGHRRTFGGLAKEDIPSNHLYGHMAKVISALAPKVFVFENVRGLLSSRWTRDGRKGEIWDDVFRTFSEVTARVGNSNVGYRIGWDLVHGYEFGVPQNRPRVILVGIRADLGYELDLEQRAGGLIPAGAASAPNLNDALGDLVDPRWTPDSPATTKYPRKAQNDLQRWYRADGEGRASGELTEHEYSRHSLRVRQRFEAMHMLGYVPANMRTKKFAQRLLPKEWEAGRATMTVASLPDDFVHFAQPRSLTVREWARLQTFPDWYQFSGSRTTGGRRRAGDPNAGQWGRELPKYTQIGNAVPVLLAKALGTHLQTVLDGLES